ncbi:MAG: hypothetical protein FJX75_03140 [Armatimonadetes bacterium]|nr:hypothetical protein [Armatimonadota bacterium]
MRRTGHALHAYGLYGPALALALLAVGLASADPWAPGTVWPARVPVRIEAEISRSDLWEWVRTDGGEWIGEWSDADATDFLRAAAHALGTELGDVEEALALRDSVERTGDQFRVTVVGRHAIWLAERADILRSSELLKRAARARADVGWAVGNDAADRLAGNRGVARIARGEWTSVREMAEQLEALAALGPSRLLRPHPAFDAWLAGPGRNVRDVRVLEALQQALRLSRQTPERATREYLIAGLLDQRERDELRVCQGTLDPV